MSELNQIEPEEDLLIEELAEELKTSNPNRLAKIYIRETQNYPVLDQQTVKDLVIRAQNGDQEANDLLIFSNIRLVIKIANFYKNKGLDLEDLIQEGIIGLIIAIQKYDINEEAKLSTYAGKWIMNKIARAVIFKSKNIHLSIRTQIKIYKVEQARRKYIYDHHAEPTTKQLAQSLKMPLDKLEKLLVAPYTISYNEKLSEESEEEIGDYLTADDSDLSDALFGKISKEEIEKLFDDTNLSETEIKVLKLRFGIDSLEGRTYSFDEIGKQFGITKAGASRIMERALGKLITNPKTKDLAIYLARPDVGKATAEQIISTEKYVSHYYHSKAEKTYEEIRKNGISKELQEKQAAKAQKLDETLSLQEQRTLLHRREQELDEAIAQKRTSCISENKPLTKMKN